MNSNETARTTAPNTTIDTLSTHVDVTMANSLETAAASSTTGDTDVAAADSTVAATTNEAWPSAWSSSSISASESISASDLFPTSSFRQNELNALTDERYSHCQSICSAMPGFGRNHGAGKGLGGNQSEETLRTENDVRILSGMGDDGVAEKENQENQDMVQQDSPLPLPVSSSSPPPPPSHSPQRRADDDAEKNDDGRIKVDWDEDDPLNPYNWSLGYKCWINVQLSMLALSASLGSSIIAPANAAIATYTHVSREAAVLSVSLYVLGFAIGPLLWAPISEIWGRRISMLPALTCLGLFSIGTATSHNAAAVFLTRFFGGVFGSAPVSNVSAAMGDIWNREQRGTAVTFYAIAVVGGPTLGPIIGSALLVGPGWRWTEYLEAIVVFAVVAISVFCLPEVYGPVLLKKKAQKLRKDTGDMRYYHPHEETKLDLNSIITKQLSRPLLMLTTEPMVTAISFYASFVFSLLYLTLEVFPIVFEEIRGYSPVVASLPFLALLIGVVIGSATALANQPRYIRKSRAAHGRPVPEARCPPMAVGGIFFTIGLFWFGWTASPSISWVSICFATVFIGMGFNSIFQQCINFLIDTYGIYAASATAGNTFLRSILAAGLPLAARPMFSAMGVGPAMSVLGAVAAVMLPMPFVFMKYGAALRRRSKFAPVYD